VFTGIVEELGTVREFADGRLEVGAAAVLEDAKIGDSIAVNGCCLTVVDLGPDWFGVNPIDETLRRTNLGDLKPGDAVNLERPLRVNDRLGGHIVQGHVDAVGEVVRPAPDLQVRMPADLLRYVIEKGSITIDGVSLTVVEVLADGFTVALIPHTTEVTTLGRRRAGERVNLEVDLVAKYIERLVLTKGDA
jgi:riboflavin synthase